jgi:hypothetical protein
VQYLCPDEVPNALRDRRSLSRAVRREEWSKNRQASFRIGASEHDKFAAHLYRARREYRSAWAGSIRVSRVLMRFDQFASG